MLRLNPRRRYSPERSWKPLSGAERSVLSPVVFRVAAVAGHLVRDPRARLDAIFWPTANTRPGRAPPPWAALPLEFGKPDTASRQFRRWAHAGLWTRLLQALADPHTPAGAVLRRFENWICRSCRRAWRVLGAQDMALARHLGFPSALRGPSWPPPDPDLSECVFRRMGEGASCGHCAAPPGLLSAPRGPSWPPPDPDLSEHVFRRVEEELSCGHRAAPPGLLPALRGPSWPPPDPDLSEHVSRKVGEELSAASAPPRPACCASLGA